MSFFKKLFSGRQDNTEAATKQPQHLEDLFQTDLDAIPDATFTVSREINAGGALVVKFNGKLPFQEAGLFDSVSVFAFESGESTITFTVARYTASQYNALHKFLNNVYRIQGADSNGNLSLPAEDERNLLIGGDHFNLSVMVFWENEGHCHFFGELNGEISFSFSRKPTDRIQLEFFLPHAALTKEGLLAERQVILDQTVAVTEYDEFAKKRSYKLLKVGDIDTAYLFTYNLESSFVAALSDLTLIAISFSYSEGLFFLHILSSDDKFPFDKGDSIIFLFEDDSTIELETIINKVRTQDGHYRTAIALTNEQVKDFAVKKLKKWKVTSNKNALYQVGGFTLNMHITQYKSAIEGQYLLQVMVKVLIRCILQYEKEAISFSLPEGE